MSFLGRTPSNAPLTTADIPDGIIVAADLAPDSVGASELADDAVDTAAIADSVTLVTPTIASMANCTFPAGHCLQVIHEEVSETNSITTSFVNYWENDITLKSASSDMFVICTFNAWIHPSAGMGFKLFRNDSATVTDSHTAVWTKNPTDGVGPLSIYAGTNENSKVITFIAKDTITGQSANDTLYYGLFLRKYDSDNVYVGADYTEDGFMSMQLMEIQK